jgi:hypothetical protein
VQYGQSPTDTRPPRGAVIVVAIGLLACVVAALAATGKSEGTAAQLEWVQHQPLPDSKPAPVPGGTGSMQLVEGGIRATGTNVSGYELYRVAAALKISAGSPVGAARVLCSTSVPGTVEVAQTPGLRATYPRSSEHLFRQDTPETVLVQFSSHGTELAVLETEDLFPRGFSTERGVKVEWPKYEVGNERWEWFLPSGKPKVDLELPFATVWKSQRTPAARVACTLTTSAGTATVSTHGGLSGKSPPIAENEEEEEEEEEEE